MANIGINSSSGDYESAYIASLRRCNFNIHTIDLSNPDFLFKKLKDLDGVILNIEAIEDITGICRLIMKIKEVSSTLIWVFSKDITIDQRIVFLQMGADMSFHNENKPEEISLSIRNALERKEQFMSAEMEKMNGEVVPCPKNTREKNVELLHSNFSFLLDNKQEISLTKNEFKVAEILYDNANVAVSYEEICRSLCDKPYSERDRFKVANIIFHLRGKLEADPKYADLIRTVRSKGYLMSL